MAVPETSIVIRTYNEEAHLPRLLEALGRQSYRDFEIVVVDSGSIDRTRDIVAPWADKLLRIDSQDFTFGYSLNVGIKAAAGKYAAIVSAHTLPADEGWLDTLVGSLREDTTAMAFGRQKGWSSSKFGEGQDLGRTFGAKRRILRPPHFFAHNANSAIKKELWEQRPFDETLPGLEDIEWVKYWMERGYQVVYEPDATLYHIHKENWRQIRRRYYREAVAARWIGVKGRRHILIDSAKEVGYGLLDLSKTLWPFGGSTESECDLKGRPGEVVLFRTNKAIGTVRGILDGNTMQDPVAREALYFDRSCRAVVIGGAGRASMEEVEIPEVKPGDVLIRTAYNGVCGTDLDLFNGKLAYYQEGSAKYPIVPGHEMSGRIVASGPNVTHVREGDAVVVENIQSCGVCEECRRSSWSGCPNRTELGVMGRNGGYGQYVVVPGRFVHPLPPGLDLAEAALIEPLAVVLKGLNRLARTWSPTSETKRCAVVGAGSLGHLCAKVLASRGHTVTAFDRDPKRRGYFQGSQIEATDDLRRLAGFDVLVEATGDPEALEAMLRQSVPGAAILLLGLSYAHKPFTFESIAAHDQTIIGSAGGGPEEFEEALRVLPDIDLDIYLQCILPLEKYRDAWTTFQQRKHLKVLLAVDAELA